ncbi:MAG: hypothetical protein NZ735_09180, partial [Candidatus Marinimicrobia bacterium]|nr:hypothetical protein [Candidatus Neomarinimicrobiota bacterium]
GLIIYSSIESYYIIKGNFEKNSVYPDRIQYVILGIMTCVIVEIIIGTEIRGGLDISREENPLIESTILLKMLGPFKYIHTILGLIFLALAYYLRKIINDINSSPSDYMVYAVNAMLAIIGIQIVLGESLVFFDVKPIVQLFHMWFSSLLLGLSIMQHTCWKISNS